MKQFEIIRYDASLADKWDEFVADSVNGCFLFARGYMDYHADRFTDHSLMILLDGHLFALLPANAEGERIVSHAGLTFGGLIIGAYARTAEILECFNSISAYLRNAGFSELIYKPAPSIYSIIPSEGDLYAIFRLFNPRICACNVSSVIDQRHRPQISQLRRRGVRKALKADVALSETSDFAPFWNILSENLRERFSASPVHSLQEITLLHNRFAQNIRLFTAIKDDKILAGAVIYLSDNVARCQYLTASPEGRKLGALDLLLEHLVSDTFAHIPYFDFGTSNEDSGHYLNEGLIAQKEGFGGRPLIYPAYSLHL